jgi:hypothetical protein
MIRLPRRGAWWWRAGAAAWMMLMFGLSSQPDLGGPLELPRWLTQWLPIDKFGHFALFAVLAALLYLAGLGARWAVLGAAIFGVSDEIHQIFVPGRSPDVRDWIADLLGALAGVWAVRFRAPASARHRER